MSLNNGESQDYADDIRDCELAVIDPSPGGPRQRRRRRRLAAEARRA